MNASLYFKQMEIGPMQNYVYLIGSTETRKAAAAGGAGSGPAAKQVNGVTLAARLLDNVPAKELKGMADEIKRQTTLMAKALNVKGLMNVQFAVQDGDVYVLEVNPRASRTVP